MIYKLQARVPVRAWIVHKPTCIATCRATENEDVSETEALLSAAEQGQAGPGKFFYFSTFVQAALIVHELRLLDIASVRQVRFFIG